MEGEDGSGDRILTAEVDKAYQDKVGLTSFRMVFSTVRGLKSGVWQLFEICRENQNVSEYQSESFIHEISSKSFSLFSVWIQDTISQKKSALSFCFRLSISEVCVHLKRKTSSS